MKALNIEALKALYSSIILSITEQKTSKMVYSVVFMRNFSLCKACA